MFGSFDDEPAIAQMGAIGAALRHYGWAPAKAVCGCARCVAEALATAPPPVHVPDADEDEDI